MRFDAVFTRLGGKEIFYVKGGVVLLVAAAALAAGLMIMNRADARLASVKREAAAFKSLARELAAEEAALEPLRRRLVSPNDKKAAGTIVEETAVKLGMKKEMSSLKPFEEKEERGYAFKGVEARFDGISLNKAVNLLYRLENYPALLTVEEFSMKSRFDNPELFDVAFKTRLVEKR